MPMQKMVVVFLTVIFYDLECKRSFGKTRLTEYTFFPKPNLTVFLPHV